MKQPAPGVIITGKYRIERPLASGGMGSVWVARHIELGVDVAIKFINQELASSCDGRARFEREAKAAALIQSSNVVHVQDYGVDGDLPYIVMELMRGEDLEDRLERCGRLPLSEVSRLTTQIARGLRRAHEIGIIHRDLKPRNLFLCQTDDEEVVKILDFGIAKALLPDLATASTMTGCVLGSPLYMCPEQFRADKDLDHRADLWALGIVIFQMTTGKQPFLGEVYSEIMARILAGSAPRATLIAPDLPPAIDGFFRKALARERQERFQSAREMAEALAEIARSWSEPASPLAATVSMKPRYTARMSGPPPSSLGPTQLAPACGTMVATISMPAEGAAATVGSERDEGASKESAGSRYGSRARVAAFAVGVLLVVTMIMLVGMHGVDRAGPVVAASVAPLEAPLAIPAGPSAAISEDRTAAPAANAPAAPTIAPTIAPTTATAAAPLVAAAAPRPDAEGARAPPTPPREINAMGKAPSKPGEPSSRRPAPQPPPASDTSDPPLGF